MKYPKKYIKIFIIFFLLYKNIELISCLSLSLCTIMKYRHVDKHSKHFNHNLIFFFQVFTSESHNNCTLARNSPPECDSEEGTHFGRIYSLPASRSGRSNCLMMQKEKKPCNMKMIEAKHSLHVNDIPEALV